MLRDFVEKFYENKLHEFDEIEWRDIMRYALKQICPEAPVLTDEQFHEEWLKFQEFKRQKQMQ